MRLADLHLHTFFSDGTYSPEQIVAQAKKAGLSCIAVVDHDTVEGIEPCLEAGRSLGIEVIAGIEFTSEYESQEIHILGYFIDYHNRALLEKLELLKEYRVQRIYKMAEKLKDMGLALNPQSVFELSVKGTVGRLHFARAMVKEGLIASTYEAFAKYIGDKCPAYVLGFRLSPSDVIKLIKDAGGIPVLAHPYTLNNNGLILTLIENGIMGLEVYYSEHSKSQTDTYLEMAKKYNLLVTGGSDCHGEAKAEIKMGSVKIPYQLVERLKAARNLYV